MLETQPPCYAEAQAVTWRGHIEGFQPQAPAEVPVDSQLQLSCHVNYFGVPSKPPLQRLH